MIFNKETISEIASFIQQEDNFLLAAHVLPDGDAVGSVIAFAEMFKSMGKKHTILLRDPVPEIYQFLIKDNVIENLNTIDREQLPNNLITLDSTEFERLGEELSFLQQHTKKILNIDHHISNVRFGDINLVSYEASATCELLYYLFKALDLPLNKEIATALYTGIVTDTGSFRYESTSVDTFLAAADLIKCGVDLGDIRENIFENKALASILAIQRSMDTLKISSDGKIAWMFIKYKAMQEMNASGEHCEGLVNYPLSISGVKMGFFFREMKDGKIKVGLRARRNYNVNDIASVFGGGGHALAAGCTMDGPIEDAIEKMIQTAQESLKGN